MVEKFAEHNGKLYRKTKSGGKPAGFRTADGYIYVGIYPDKYPAHHIVWLLHYKQWPKYEIDHINGNRADNRIENLRDVTRSINGKGFSNRKPKQSGYIGVIRNGYTKTWTAHFRDNDSKLHTIEGFTHLEDAIEIRKMAERIFNYHRTGELICPLPPQ
ncbi:MAG: HNH endonuclease [Bdellovibrionaceae bacterium]|nr:HNH endonuclease [Pseudobdellovibrionaceae bacterium]